MSTLPRITIHDPEHPHRTLLRIAGERVLLATAVFLSPFDGKDGRRTHGVQLACDLGMRLPLLSTRLTTEQGLEQVPGSSLTIQHLRRCRSVVHFRRVRGDHTVAIHNEYCRRVVANYSAHVLGLLAELRHLPR